MIVSSLLLVLWAGLCLGEEDTSPVVTLPQLGQLRGKLGLARNKTVTFYKFLGVPFAAPPTGDKRFGRPEAVQPWTGTKEAVRHGRPCLQMENNKVVGSEDCLYLNIFTRSLDSTEKKPVIVYIHGGQFSVGSNSRLGGEYMMEEDVVLVTIQYRLNMFGFLSTEDKVAPGNYGLHDQVAALRWVQQNILQFGGDRRKVTVMGMSAGGASVHYLLLSPTTDGLFHRAVSLSGSALCWWANLPRQAVTARRLGQEVGCPDQDSRDMLACLREKTGKQLVEAGEKLFSWRAGTMDKEPMNIWSPRPDKEAGDAAILPISPHMAMEAGQIQPVPFLVGIAEHEGIWRANNYLAQDEVMLEMVRDYKQILPHALGLVDEVPEGKMEEVISEIKMNFMDATHLPDPEKKLKKIVSGMVDMFGDTMFTYPVDRMVKMHGNKDHCPVWLMTFSYPHNHSLAYFDPANPGEHMKPAIEELQKATHGAHIGMMFPAFVKEFGKLSSEETMVSRKFINLIAEFARRGVPNEFQKRFKAWKPLKNGQLNHLDTGKYFGMNKGLPFQERMRFWHERPIYWRKHIAGQGVRTPEVEMEVSESDEVEEIIAEELTDEELEEVELAAAAEIMKAGVRDEL